MAIFVCSSRVYLTVATGETIKGLAVRLMGEMRLFRECGRTTTSRLADEAVQELR
jgi:hypothetical protein